MKRLVSIVLGSTVAAAAAAASAQTPPQSYRADFPDMLLAYMAKQLNGLAEKWDAERARIQTPAAIEARNRFVRDTARKMIHGLPERCAECRYRRPRRRSVPGGNDR